MHQTGELEHRFNQQLSTAENKQPGTIFDQGLRKKEETTQQKPYGDQQVIKGTRRFIAPLNHEMPGTEIKLNLGIFCVAQVDFDKTRFRLSMLALLRNTQQDRATSRSR